MIAHIIPTPYGMFKFNYPSFNRLKRQEPIIRFEGDNISKKEAFKFASDRIFSYIQAYIHLPKSYQGEC